MDKLTRLYRLHQLLAGRRVGLPLQSIMEDLECSRATANRVIQEMRLTFNAPIVYDREQQGYRYDRSGAGGFEALGQAGAAFLFARLPTHFFLLCNQFGSGSDAIGCNGRVNGLGLQGGNSG